ncbi:hypothetical protein [Sansalvadorimonas verongulae]|uniref:hypothetical protein n=1 Tax=Sansalvadorimonas verongulae TaxID=2172824 RepID=UPI0012BC95F3|nr:hypothetical protein [Sansalvadorimonas verongulae]MTI12254.1 hypothetical protein [Sansalvadorimonas verongulae]
MPNIEAFPANCKSALSTALRAYSRLKDSPPAELRKPAFEAFMGSTALIARRTGHTRATIRKEVKAVYRSGRFVFPIRKEGTKVIYATASQTRGER